MKSAMDKELLNALDNLSYALEEVAKSLDKKDSPAKSATGNALQSGDFGEHFQLIQEGLKSIKDDTSKILDNQQTIIKLQKQKSNEKVSVFEESGQKGRKKQMISDGVGVIILIASAVLAIGMAFKLIGEVDWKSVLAISVALPLIAFAFERISKIKDLTPGKMLQMSIVTTIMSLGVVASSHILSGVKPLSLPQLFTTIFLSGTFAFMGMGLSALISSMQSDEEVGFGPFKVKKKGMKFSTVLAASGAALLILVAASTGIMLSSRILAGVKPLGFGQLLTTAIIGLTFGFLGQGIAALISAITTDNSIDAGPLGKSKSKGISMAQAAAAALILPVILVGISYAISESSKILSNITPISIFQGLTAIMISGVFVVLSFGLAKILQSTKDIKPAQAFTAGLILVGLAWSINWTSDIFSKITPISFSQFLTALAISVVFIALSVAAFIIFKGVKGVSPKEAFTGSSILVILAAAVFAASIFLNMMDPVPISKIISFTLLAIGLGISTVILGVAAKILDALGIPSILKGSVAIVILAGTIMISSHLISMGNYSNYPPIMWALGTVISIGLFGISAVLLGSFLTNPMFYMGIGVIVILSLTVAAVSHILAIGNYDKYPSIGWALGVGLSMASFGIGAVLLGAQVFNPLFWMGLPVILTLAATMVGLSYILSEGSFDTYPPVIWAAATLLFLGGIALTMPMFALVAPLALMGLPVVLALAGTIYLIDKIFSGGSFNTFPNENWAKGVESSLIGFSNSLSKIRESISFADLVVGSIKILGLVSAISSIDESFKGGDFKKYPSKDWVDGTMYSLREMVKISGEQSFLGAIGDAIAGLFGADSGSILVGMAESIRDISIILSGGSYMQFPSREWVDGSLYALMKFQEIKNLMSSQSGGMLGQIAGSIVDSLTGTKDPLLAIAESIVLLGKAFKQLNQDIQGIDLERLELVKSFTGNMVLLSLMDADQFEDMMDKLEEKSGSFSDIYQQFQEAKKGEGSSGGLGVSGPTTMNAGSSTEMAMKALGDKFDSMTAILADIASGVGSNGYLKKHLSSLKDDKSFLSPQNAPTSK